MIDSRVHFNLLGPFEAEVQGHAVYLTRRQRALCTVLLIHANHAVSVDRIIDQLWEDRPPRAGAARVRALVTEVRRALGERGRLSLETRSPGYVLTVGKDALDLARFEELVRQGGRAEACREWAAAATCYHAALGLWRGDPLPDLSSVAATVERQRLEELRLVAVEGAASAEIEEGDHRRAIRELLRFVAQYPFRERPHALLMRALQRDGRVAEALAVYTALRRRMVDELGMEPSADLNALHRRLLGTDSDEEAAPVPAVQETRPRLPLSLIHI